VLLSLANDSPAGRSDSFFQKFSAERILAGLRSLDASADPSHPLARIGMEFDGSGRLARNGYGVFGVAWRAEKHPEWAAQVDAEAADLRSAIKNAHRAPLRFSIWAAAGATGEDASMYQAAGLLKRGPRCYVLDSADPAKLKAILDDIERRYGLSISSILRGTLVVGTSLGIASREPVVNLQKLANLYDRHRIDSRIHFLSLAAEGSELDSLARERGYRRAALQLDGDGRHGGPLARGSLYPLALARADLVPWIRNACLSDKDIYTAWRLASFLHAQGETGRDKVTLLLPKPWAGAGLWTKRSFEESLGQSDGLGLKLIPCPKPRLANYRSPKDPQQDRVFVAVRVNGMPKLDTAKVALLRRAGYPVAVLTLPRGALLSRYIQFIHYGVFGMAWLRGANFVARPAADLHESIASRIFSEATELGGVKRTPCWKRMESSPRQVSFRGELTLHYDRLKLNFNPAGMDAPQLYAAILRSLASRRNIEYGDLTFFGDTRYSPAGGALRRILDHAADALFERRLNMPADVQEGPAATHACHETILGHGRSFSTLLLSEAQETLAAARYAPDYHVAQFLAAQVALEERGRAAVAITLRNLEEAGLRALEEFFHRAAACLKPGRF
jgi:hypothetical protein